MGKKVIFLFMAIVLVAGLGGVIGCETEKGIAAIDLVPQTANLAASVNLNRIFADEDVLDIINEIAANLEEPKTVDELLDQVKEKAGVDLRDFSEVLVFGDFESEDYLGAIVKGDFDQAALIDSIESAIGEELSSSDYKGYEIYSSPSNEAAICFLSSDTILVGSRVAVKDAIDVKEGAPSLDEPIYGTYNALGDAWFTVAAEMPAEAMAEISEELPPGLDALLSMQTIGLSFNKVGVNLSFQLKLLYPNSTSAEDAKGAFDALKGMLAFIPDLPDEVTEIVDRLFVSQSGSWLTISLEATKAEIRDWARDLGTAFQDMESMWEGESGQDTCEDDEAVIQIAVYAFYYESGGDWPTTDFNAPGDINWAATDGLGGTFVGDYLIEILESDNICDWHIDAEGMVCADNADCPCGIQCP